jgi:hypothetical protein
MKKLHLLLVTFILLAFMNNSNSQTLLWDSLMSGTSGKNPVVKALIIDTSSYSYHDTLYAGGDFSIAGRIACRNIAIYNYRGVWDSLGSGVNGEVTALTRYRNRLIAGGAFDTAGGTSANHIAMWNTKTWDSINGGVDGQVYALFAYDTLLYAGGNFTHSNRTNTNRISQWNGASWSALGAGFDSGTVYCLAIYNGELYAGGTFTKSNGKQANYIARWNGTIWDSVGTGMNNAVYALIYWEGKLYAGGAFTMAGGIKANYIAMWNGSTWDSVGPGFNDTVRALGTANVPPPALPRIGVRITIGEFLFAGGNFTMSGDSVMYHIAAWNTSFSRDSTWFSLGKVNSNVLAIASSSVNEYGGGNYIGGQFDTSNSFLNTNYVAYFLFDNPGGIPSVTVSSNGAVYPNPNNGKFTIEIKNEKLIMNNEKPQIEIYNLMGEKVFSQYYCPSRSSSGQAIPDTQYSIDLCSRSAGVYFYRVVYENGSLIGEGKEVIQR